MVVAEEELLALLMVVELTDGVVLVVVVSCAGDEASLVGVVGVEVVLAMDMALNLDASAVTLFEVVVLVVLDCVVAEAVVEWLVFWCVGLVLPVAKMLLKDDGVWLLVVVGPDEWRFEVGDAVD